MRPTLWAVPLLLAVAMLTACGDSTDRPALLAPSTATTSAESDLSEAAWRAALGLEGIPDKVWKRYRNHVYDVCDDSENTFKLFVTMMLDDNDREGIGRFRKSLPYACTERVELFDNVVAFSEDPCAGKTPAERRELERVMHAMGEHGWTCP